MKEIRKTYVYVCAFQSTRVQPFAANVLNEKVDKRELLRQSLNFQATLRFTRRFVW